MNKSQSRYFNTANKMDEALLSLLRKKDFEFISIKEVCELAGVNRSTFYLHYENLNDLLLETGEYVNRKFFSYFEAANIHGVDLNNSTNEHLNFITPKYLTPWLLFIKENKKLFKTVMMRSNIFLKISGGSDMFENFINPVLDRLIIEKENHKYILSFYVEGIIAIVKEWLNDNCDREIDEIIDLIVKCVNA